MSQPLFAERFLVAPVGAAPPEPAGYDEALGISVTADGRPFIEARATLGTRTFTEAVGESTDDDVDSTAHSAAGAWLGTRTATFVDAEGADTDRAAAAALGTETRAEGEKADVPAWARTETAAPGEPVDYDSVGFLGTVTKAEGESND